MKKKKIIKILTTVSITLGLGIFAQAIPASAAGTFSVDGTNLKDSNGKQFVMRGVNIPNSWYFNQSLSAMDKALQYGSNAVRIVWETNKSASQLDQVLSKAKNDGLVAIPELHNVTGNSDAGQLNSMAQYWSRSDVKSVLAKYSDYVIVNIANEWGDHYVQPYQWQEAYQTAIKTMRDAGIKNTIMVDASGWGQNAKVIIEKGKYVLDSDPLKNVMFSVHMYGSYNDRNSIYSTLEQIQNQGLCVIVGEFGYNYNNGGNNLGCTVDADEVMQQCKYKNVGYLAWSWAGNDNDNKWLDLTYDWNNLTPWGQQIFNSSNGIRNTAKPATFGGNGDEKPPVDHGNKIVAEAENGSKNGTYTSTSRGGYSGSGYVTGFDNWSDSVEVTVNVPQSGDYYINTQYASPYGDKYTELYVNNADKGGKLLKQSNNFTDAYLDKVYLNAGKNTIKLQQNWGYYDIDNFTITRA